jgi:hypothetical protein
LAAAVLNWIISVAQNIILEYFLRLNTGMPMGQFVSILSYIFTAYTLFTTLVALYLLIMYAVSVLRAKNKWLQIKAELHKPALAVMLLGLNLTSVVRTIINRIMINRWEVGMIDLQA